MFSIRRLFTFLGILVGFVLLLLAGQFYIMIGLSGGADKQSGSVNVVATACFVGGIVIGIGSAIANYYFKVADKQSNPSKVTAEAISRAAQSLPANSPVPAAGWSGAQLENNVPKAGSDHKS